MAPKSEKPQGATGALLFTRKARPVSYACTAVDLRGTRSETVHQNTPTDVGGRAFLYSAVLW